MAFATAVLFVSDFDKAVFAQTGVLTDLGNWEPSVLSADGSVVAGRRQPGEDTDQGFRVLYWTDAGGLHDMFTPEEGIGPFVTAISSDGSTIYGFEHNTINDISGDYSFKWSQSGGKSDMAKVGEARSSGAVMDLSADDNVAVGTYQPFTAQYYPVRWDAGVPSTVGVNNAAIRAVTVSGDGSTILGEDLQHVYRWTSNSDWQLLHMNARWPSVSDDGDVYVYSDRTTFEVFRVESNVSTRLGGSTTPAKISGDGRTVIGNGTDTAILSIDGGPFVSLTAFAVSLGTQLNGLLIKGATGVSYDGSVIAGRYFENGTSQAWRLAFVACAPDEVRWTGSAGSEYAAGANWDGPIPGEESTAVFNLGNAAEYSVTITQDRRVDGFRVDGDVVTANQQSTTLTLLGDCLNSIEVRSGGSLKFEGGTVNAGGNVVVEGGLQPQLVLSAESQLFIDHDGDGRGDLEISTSAGNALVQLAQSTALSSPNLTIIGDRSGDSGELQVGGLFNGKFVDVGNRGEGELFVETSGFVVAERLVAGRSGDGMVTIDGGGLETSEAIIALEGGATASMVVRDLGDVDADNLVAGDAAGASGNVILNHAGADFDVVTLGRNGFGHMEIAQGATVNSTNLAGRFALGLFEGSLGTMTIEDADSELLAKYMVVGDGGAGELVVTGGPQINIDYLAVSKSGPGSIALDGGSSINVNTLDLGPDAVVTMDGIILIGDEEAGKLDPTQGDLIHASTLILRGQPTIAADTITFLPGARLGGTGVFPFDLTNVGTIVPGDTIGSTGELTIDGRYRQDPSGALDLDLGGVLEGEYDRLRVNGTAELAGTLRVSVTKGFVGKAATEFEIVAADTIIGEFEVTESPDIRYDLIYGPQSVTLVITSGVSTENVTPPAQFALHANYPNPLSSVTVITYSLAVTTHVELSIFDILGRIVAKPVDAVRPAGEHTVAFNAERLESGLYFYRLAAEDHVETRTMTVLK